MCKEFPFKISLLGKYPNYLLILKGVTQSAITCSKLTKINNKDNGVVLVSLKLTLNII